MSILTANLKHLYQRRALWLFYPFVILLLPAMFVGSEKGGGRPLALLLVFVLGLVFGSSQREVASRPFSFLLPRHTGLIPRQALIQGAFFGLLVPLCWLRLPGLGLVPHPGLLLTTWLLGTACYLGGTLASFSVPYVAPFLGFLPLTIFGCTLLALPPILNVAIQDFPLRTALVALFGVACAWRFLRRRSLGRHWALQRSIAFFDEFNFPKATQYHQWRRAQRVELQPEQGNPALVRFLLTGVASTTPRDLLRYVWATWYEWFGLVTAKRWLGMLLMWPVITLFTGYFAGGTNSLVVFVMPVIMAVSLRRTYLAAYLPAGRAQRHLAAVVAMLIVTAFTTALAWLFVLISQPIAPAMPQLKLPTGTMTFLPFPYLYALIPTVLAPVAFAAAVWLRRQMAMLLLVAIPLVPVMVILSHKPIDIPVALWPLIPLVSLLVSVGALRYHCLRRDLV